MTEERWGNFILRELLNSGGTAEIFIATDNNNHEVVLRRLKSTFKFNLFKRSEFTRGLEIQGRLNHPSIVRVLELHSISPIPYAILEKVEGANLRHAMLKFDLTPKDRLDIFEQFLQALSHLHENKYLHLDFKPENVLVNFDRKVKLVDFDLSEKLHDPPRPQRDLHGTTAYISPEQILRKPVDERTDIFAAGLTAFELFANQKAFLGRDRQDIFNFYTDMTQPFPSPRSVQHSITPTLDHLISRCIEKSPEKRYPSVAMILRDLQQYRHSLDPHSGL